MNGGLIHLSVASLVLDANGVFLREFFPAASFAAIKPRQMSLSMTTHPPVDSSCFQNSPNPFNPSTVVRFRTPAADHVRLDVPNVLGRQTPVPVDETGPAGICEITLDGSDWAITMYVCRLHAGDAVQRRRLVLVKWGLSVADPPQGGWSRKSPITGEVSFVVAAVWRRELRRGGKAAGLL